jgi:hypothetical protein
MVTTDKYYIYKANKEGIQLNGMHTNNWNIIQSIQIREHPLPTITNHPSIKLPP